MSVIAKTVDKEDDSKAIFNAIYVVKKQIVYC